MKWRTATADDIGKACRFRDETFEDWRYGTFKIHHGSGFTYTFGVEDSDGHEDDFAACEVEVEVEVKPIEAGDLVTVPGGYLRVAAGPTSYFDAPDRTCECDRMVLAPALTREPTLEDIGSDCEFKDEAGWSPGKFAGMFVGEQAPARKFRSDSGVSWKYCRLPIA